MNDSMDELRGGEKERERGYSMTPKQIMEEMIAKNKELRQNKV